jgi:putative acetyltransferase
MGIIITIADPAHPPVRALVEELDAYLIPLYPVGSINLLDIETLRQPEIRFFAAFRDDEVLAIGGCWRHGGYAEVKRLYVTPAARGLGLAKQIIQRIEAEARASGCTLARLVTGIHQPESLQLYPSLGYVDCGAFGDYPADDPNSVFMEKRLG